VYRRPFGVSPLQSATSVVHHGTLHGGVELPPKVSVASSLRRQLREAGVAPKAIKAVWPEWWSADAESSLSATTELRYTVAKRLGIAPSSLFDGPPRFIWKDDAKYKNLGTATPQDQAILTSFGVAVARALSEGISPSSPRLDAVSALELRAAILDSSDYVGLTELVIFCWAFGIPVVTIGLFPLGQKRMHAMTVRMADRYSILIGRHSSFPAQTAYTLAHEVGHIMLRHVANSAALLEMADPLTAAEPDDEEADADRFALALLTGQEQPEVVVDQEDFNAAQLAQAVVDAGPQHRVDPGVLALCAGHSTGRWRQTFAALRQIPGGTGDVAGFINDLAKSQLGWDALPFETQDYLGKVLEVPSVA
jgi:hypothetical protein